MKKKLERLAMIAGPDIVVTVEGGYYEFRALNQGPLDTYMVKGYGVAVDFAFGIQLGRHVSTGVTCV